MDAVVPVQQSMIVVHKLEELVSRERSEFDILEEAGHCGPLFETEENMSRVF